MRRRDTPADAGSVTAMVAILALSFVLVAGLAVDGGRKLAMIGAAKDLADDAARAGAQELDVDEWRLTGEAILDAGEAERAAREHLASLGHSASSVSVVGDTVEVTVTLRRAAVILPVGELSVTATGSSRADQGEDA